MNSNYSNQDLENAIATVKSGGVILYPTDTIWGLGCDAGNVSAIEKIFAIKSRSSEKSMIILVNNLEMLSNFIDFIPDTVKNYWQTENRPTTFVFQNAKNLPANVTAKDKSIAVRLVKDLFCENLIRGVGFPIVSTSANISNQNFDGNFQNIPLQILQSVDYTCVYKQNITIKSQPSKIFKVLEDGCFLCLRA